MPLHYRGNHAKPFNPDTGAGLIGKVVGPDYDGEQHVVTDAAYDAETGVTTAELRMVGGLANG
jgi:hypothetical protein